MATGSRDATGAGKPGDRSLGPEDGTLLINTGREGVAARVGHDLTLEVGRWSATLRGAGATSPPSHLGATIDATSLVVREGRGGAKPLSDNDIADITKNIADKVLATRQHPEVTFVSTSIEMIDDTHVAIAGDLRIVGRARPVRFELEAKPLRGAMRVRGGVAIVQSEWGIKQYSALLGTLRVRDEVEISIDVSVPIA